MKTRKSFWRLSAFLVFAVLLSAVFTFTGCNDDDDGEEPEEETLAGVYQMTEALLTTDIEDTDGNVVVPSGTNVTAIMASGIFGASPCDNPLNSAIDMRDGGKLYFVCIGNEADKQAVDAGGWEENQSLTQLTLTLNSTVVPPLGFQLTITNVSVSGAVVSGSITSVPITAQLLNVAFPDATFDPVVFVGADVKFTMVGM